MTRLLTLGALSLLLASVMLQAGQAPSPTQPVPKGQMPTLGRHTEQTDTVPLLDFDAYFLGKWTFEWSLPDSALGTAGAIAGSTIVTKRGGALYEAATAADGPAGPFTITERITYDRENKTMRREVADSRGFSYVQSGTVAGDLGGIYYIHLESEPFLANGQSVRVRNDLRLLSPLNYRVATSISVDGGPFTNLGNPWWRKDLSYVGPP